MNRLKCFKLVLESESNIEESVGINSHVNLL